MKIQLILTGLLSVIASATAAETLVFEDDNTAEMPLAQYFRAEDNAPAQSMIYVFFNNEPCPSCPAAIELTEQIYDREYQGVYGFSIINYQEDDEYDFVETYNLSRPLSVVLARYDDGAAFGFEKLDDLPERVSDPVSFADYFRYRVNSFLGAND